MVPALLTRMSTRPSCGHDLAEELFGSGVGGEVGLEGVGAATGRDDGGGGFIGGAAVAMDGDSGSALCEAVGDGGAEAAGCSGDEGDLVVETEAVEDGGHG